MTSITRAPKPRAAERRPATSRGPTRRRPLGPPAGRRTSQFMAIAGLVGLLCALGLVMVLSASAAEGQSEVGSPWYQIQRQATWLGVGLVALVLSIRVELSSVRRHVRWALPVSLALLVAVLVPGVGEEVNGSTRWLGVGPLTLQPSELAKLVLLVWTADLLARRAHRVDDTRATLRPVVTVFAITAGLIMLQPNLGTTALIFAIVATMLFVAGVPGRALLGVTAALGGLGVLAAVVEPYRFRRLSAFVDPWEDPLDTGYQTLQSQAHLADGGPLGQGLGQGRAKFGFLPEVHTDFIFTNIGEELGLLGAVVVLALFVALGALGVSVAMRAPDRFGMLVATGVTAWILFQAFVNLGAVVGVLPITGVPLPFVSSGGSSLVVTLAATGLLLNVARQVR